MCTNLILKKNRLFKAILQHGCSWMTGTRKKLGLFRIEVTISFSVFFVNFCSILHMHFMEFFCVFINVFTFRKIFLRLFTFLVDKNQEFNCTSLKKTLETKVGLYILSKKRVLSLNRSVVYLCTIWHSCSEDALATDFKKYLSVRTGRQKIHIWPPNL